MRRSSVAFSAAILLLLSAGITQAADEPPLPAALTAAVARDLHLSAAQYLDRAHTAQTLSAFSRTFPGSRVQVDSSGRGVVTPPAGTDFSATRDAAVAAGFVVTDISAPFRLAEQAIPTVVAPVANIGSERLGGDPFAAVGNGVGFRCSLGFNGTDATGATVNISAGHCDPHSAAAGTATASSAFLLDGPARGPHIGTFVRSNSGAHDYSIIRIDDDESYRFQNNAIRVPAQAPLEITGTADPVLGAPVCKSGNTTGFTCGIVTAVNETIPVGGGTLTNAFSTNICALQGDSGGTLVTGTLALGISSASNVGEFGLCELASIATFVAGETPELYAMPINVILADNPGIAIRTS